MAKQEKHQAEQRPTGVGNPEQEYEDAMRRLAGPQLDELAKICQERRPGVAAKLKEIETNEKAQQKALGNRPEQNGDEQAEYDKSHRAIHRKAEQETRQVNEDATLPFVRMQNVMYPFSVKAQEKALEPAGANPDMDRIFDEVPASEAEKLECLHYLRDFSKTCGGVYAGMDVKDQESYKGEKSRVAAYLQRFGVMTENGKNDALAPAHSDLVSIATAPFTDRDVQGKSREQVMSPAFQRLGEFCDRQIGRIYDRQLRNGTFAPKQEADLRKCSFLNASDSFVPRSRKESGLSAARRSTRLSFGRKGSEQFETMNGMMDEVCDNIRRQLESGGNLKELNEKLEQLELAADRYLTFKNDQLANGKIGRQPKRDENGQVLAGEYVAKNSTTQKRMDFAAKVKAEAHKLREAVKAWSDFETKSSAKEAGANAEHTEQSAEKKGGREKMTFAQLAADEGLQRGGSMTRPKRRPELSPRMQERIDSRAPKERPAMSRGK